MNSCDRVLHYQSITKQQNFSLVQIQKVCRRHSSACSDGENCFIGTCRNHCENAGYQFSSFPTMFLKGFFLNIIRTVDCFVKGMMILSDTLQGNVFSV